MMIPKEAIEKAIEGGWMPRTFAVKEFKPVFGNFDFEVEDTETGATILKFGITKSPSTPPSGSPSAKQ